MSRAVTTEFMRALFGGDTDEVAVFLMTITHPSLSDPIHVCSNPTVRLSETDDDVIYGTISRGVEYVFFPFTIQLPEDGDDGPSAMTLTLDNVAREYTAVLRSIQGPPTILTEIVLASSPDVVQADWPDFLLTNTKISATTITGTLALEALHNEPFPAGTFSPAYFPALF